MASVTIRSPESSSVKRWPGMVLPAVRVAVAARGARRTVAVAPTAAAVTATVAAAAVAVAVAAAAARATVTAAAAAHRRVARADRGELLLGLAGDLRVLGEAQADAAALLVDLDDADGDLVALVEHLFDRPDAVARRYIGDVQQAVGALGELDEGAEGRGLDHLRARELVADLDLLGHRADALDQRVALRAGDGVDEHLALVVDVDLGLVLLLERADRLAALADQQADLLRIDLDRADPRGELGELLARGVDRLGHLAQDELATLLGLGQGLAHDLERDARDLDVHLQRGDAVRGAGDLEVHVAQVVLDAGDVGQDRVVVALLDQAHGDAGDRPLERHAGVHEAERRAADRRHRGRAVGLQDVRHDADRVREGFLVGDHRDQRALGECAVADVAALGAAHEARLAHGEGREVVVVEVALGGLQPERVQAHLFARGAEGDHGEGLGLAAGEQRRAVRARQRLDLDGDRPDLLLGAAVRALLADRDALADDPLLQRVERLLGLRAVFGVRVGLGRARVLLDDRGLDGLGLVLALELVVRRGRLVELRAVRALDLRDQVLVDSRRGDLDLGLADLLTELVHGGRELLDLRVRDVERVEDLGLGHLVGAGLDHQDRLGGAGHDQVEVGLGDQLLGRVDDEVALDLADAHGADGGPERDVGDGERRGGAVHRKDVVRVDVIHRQGQRDQLGLTPPALREQRAQRAVDHARGQGALLAGTALALEEGAGDLARGVHALLDVDREREEVDPLALVAGGRRTEHHRVAGLHHHGAGGLLGHLAGLERDL